VGKTREPILIHLIINTTILNPLRPYPYFSTFPQAVGNSNIYKKKALNAMNEFTFGKNLS